MVQETIFSPLFYSDASGALHAGLAAQIPTVANGGISADGLTYTFHLRPGLKWSDGAPLDARDVDYSWQHLDRQGPDRQQHRRLRPHQERRRLSPTTSASPST